MKIVGFRVLFPSNPHSIAISIASRQPCGTVHRRHFCGAPSISPGVREHLPSRRPGDVCRTSFRRTGATVTTARRITPNIGKVK